MVGVAEKNGSKPRIRRSLSGDNNQCTKCHKFFKSGAGFTKHRTGEFGVDRRCMTTEEMLAIGMGLNARDFWVTALFEGGIHFTASVEE